MQAAAQSGDEAHCRIAETRFGAIRGHVQRMVEGSHGSEQGARKLLRKHKELDHLRPIDGPSAGASEGFVAGDAAQHRRPLMAVDRTSDLVERAHEKDLTCAGTEES